MPYKAKGEEGEGLRKKDQGPESLELVTFRIPKQDREKLEGYFEKAGHRSFSEGMRVIIRQALRERGLV